MNFISPFEDDEAERAIREAIAGDNTAALPGGTPDRAATLAQMYPANHPLSEGDVGQDMMVSLPGQALGNELRASPGESEVVAESPPFAGPPPRREAPSFDAPASPPAPREGGFDMARALAALGGNLGAFDANRRAKEEAPLRRAQQQAQMADLSDRADERRLKSQDLRDSLDPNSESSKSAVADYARANAMRAELLASRNPKLAEMFRQEATRAQGKSRAQIAQMAKTNDSIMGDFGKMLDREVRERMLSSREADVDADNKRADKALEFKMRPRTGGGTSKEEAKRIQLQIKSIDKKAIEELQNMGTMDSMFNEAEQLLPEAYTGPGAGAAVKVNDTLKAVGLGGIVPDKISKSLDATQKLGAEFEQAIADMRKGRFGSSLTDGERAAVREWAPNKQLSEEGNRNLMAAARKYMALRIQERLGQVLQEVGVPFYLPPGTVMDVKDAQHLKSLFSAMNFYDSSQTAETIDGLNAILGKYGGKIAGAPSKAIAAQVGKGAAPKAAASSDEKPPSRPGSKPGEKLRNKRTGTVWTWDGSQWSK